ncbi:MAG: hypothetical protein JST68_15615 [Bacteroidetes bacterium]|nr:hypothetical protein [Bacteroidota bacterium]
MRNSIAILISLTILSNPAFSQDSTVRARHTHRVRHLHAKFTWIGFKEPIKPIPNIIFDHCEFGNSRRMDSISLGALTMYIPHPAGAAIALKLIK